jgi:hypothetical protein
MTKLIYVGEATIIKFTWLFISYNLIIIICCCQNTANTMILWIFFTRMFISCDLVIFLFFWPKYNFNKMIWRKFSEYLFLFVSCFQEIGTITLQIFLVYNINYKFWVSEWLFFNANSAIFQLYHGENKLIFNEMMMRSALYQINTLSCIFIVLAHWNNSPRIEMLPHSDTLSWFWLNQTLYSYSLLLHVYQRNRKY